jgi:hypothetical protein
VIRRDSGQRSTGCQLLEAASTRKSERAEKRRLPRTGLAQETKREGRTPRDLVAGALGGRLDRSARAAGGVESALGLDGRWATSLGADAVDGRMWGWPEVGREGAWKAKERNNGRGDEVSFATRWSRQDERGQLEQTHTTFGESQSDMMRGWKEVEFEEGKGCGCRGERRADDEAWRQQRRRRAVVRAKGDDGLRRARATRATSRQSDF